MRMEVKLRQERVWVGGCGGGGGRGGAPHAKEERAGVGSHDVVRHDVGVGPPHVPDVLKKRVALLPPADENGVWRQIERLVVHLRVLSVLDFSIGTTPLHGYVHDMCLKTPP